MKTETIEEFLARGGTINPWYVPEEPQDAKETRSWNQIQYSKKRRGRPPKKVQTQPEQAPITDMDGDGVNQ